MKNLLMILIAIVTFSLSTHAANYGKFRLTVNGEFNGAEQVTFLLNTAGELSILENDSYYDINADFFFGDTSLSFQSGGDEEHIEGIISLKGNKAVDGCSAYVDVKNEYIIFMGKNNFLLERWNKFSKKYESVYSDSFQFSKACEDNIESKYEDFDEV